MSDRYTVNVMPNQVTFAVEANGMRAAVSEALVEWDERADDLVDQVTVYITKQTPVAAKT